MAFVYDLKEPLAKKVTSVFSPSSARINFILLAVRCPLAIRLIALRFVWDLNLLITHLIYKTLFCTAGETGILYLSHGVTSLQCGTPTINFFIIHYYTHVI